MRLDETSGGVTPASSQLIPRLRYRRGTRFLLLFLLFGMLLGGSAPASLDRQRRALDVTVQAWDWDLVGWMSAALIEKVAVVVDQPAEGVTGAAAQALVDAYLGRAGEIGRVERAIDELIATGSEALPRRLPALESELDYLRGQQELIRPAVEQLLEEQVSQELVQAGLSLGGAAFPPVLFTFSEPPRKLVVSPRERIETVYYAMLQPALPPDERSQIEEGIYRHEDLSAYVANIGGLGAYPALVIDRAPLDWVLTTVAHEWTHNYLTLFPLGLNYTTSPELTILNETVADIVGDEVGRQALERFTAPPEAATEATPTPAAPAVDEPAFDFRAEMRETREVVDRLLAFGRVADAEAYMEVRRLLFLENGYNLRRLNQAYFAFHGSYGTGPAASSPIGPKLERLRTLMPDLRTFLETVRWFTSAADLDRALAAWEAAPGTGD